jgi:hypothetical protein
MKQASIHESIFGSSVLIEFVERPGFAFSYGSADKADLPNRPPAGVAHFL